MALHCIFPNDQVEQLAGWASIQNSVSATIGTHNVEDLHVPALKPRDLVGPEMNTDVHQCDMVMVADRSGIGAAESLPAALILDRLKIYFYLPDVVIVV